MSVDQLIKILDTKKKGETVVYPGEMTVDGRKQLKQTIETLSNHKVTVTYHHQGSLVEKLN